MEMESSNCAFCRQRSNLLCQRCFEDYCSVECQILDWAKHKLICRPIPPLVPKQKINLLKQPKISTSNSLENVTFQTVPSDKLTSLVSNHTQQISSSNEVQFRNRSQAMNIVPMRRPRSSSAKLDSSQKINKDDPNSNLSNSEQNKIVLVQTNENNLLKTTSSQVQNSFLKDNNQSQHNEKPKLLENTGFKEQDSEAVPVSSLSEINNFDIMQERSANNKTEIIKINENLLEPNNFITSPWKIPFIIPEKVFFFVTVQYYDSNSKIAWVTDSTLLDNQHKLLREINLSIDKMVPVPKTEIHRGSIYAAQFEGIYYRAVCLEELTKSNEIKVRLIDYGNDFVVDVKNLKLPIPIMKNLNSFVFCINYPDNLEIGKKIKVKILKKIVVDPYLGDVYVVQEDINGQIVTHDLFLQSNISIPRNNILKSLPNQFNLKLINFIGKNKNSGFVSIVQNEIKNELEKMNSVLNSEKTFQYDLNSTPNKDDFIVGRCGKFWKRGIVLGNCENISLIFFVDFGEIDFVEQIKQIPAAYKYLPYQISIINIDKILINNNEFNTRLTPDIILEIRNFSSKDSTGKCSLFEGDDKLADVTLKSFEGNLIQLMGNNLWYHAPTHRNIIRITNVIDYCTIYIALDSLYNSYKDKLNDIGKSLEKKFHFTNNGAQYKTGSIVIVKINSSNYIRCRIKSKSINKTDEYEVQDIDTGKNMLVKNNSMGPVNDIVQLMPVITVKRTLNILNKIQINNPKSNKGFLQLNLFSEQKEKFILKIENLVEEEITLSPIDKDGESINKLLIPLLYQEIDPNQEYKNINKKVIENTIFEETNKMTEIQQEKPNNNKSTTMTKYYIKDIVIEPIKCGENVPLLILDNSNLIHGYITAGMKDLNFFEKLFGVYQKQINDYCNDIKNGVNYTPEKDELCLALFDGDGEWYRAFCIDITKNGEIQLMFLDFGNKVIKTANDIRKFDKNFLYKSIANTCFIEDIPKMPNQRKIDELAELIFSANTIFVADKVNEMKNNIYSVELKGVDQYFM